MRTKLLTDTEACIHLGITKELLYAYIRYAPKKALQHDRKLISVVVEGKNMFEEKELDSFNTYLHEPWSKEGEKRPDIPKFIQDYLKNEIDGSCPITKKGFPLENAHIEDYSISRSHHHHNIIRIAKDEHTKFDAGVLSKEFLKQTKDRLVENLRQKLRIEIGSYAISVNSPKPHELFVGRDIELIELTAAMETEQLVVIEGIGGGGKTQLLLNAIDNVKYHCPIIWIDLETISTLDDLIILISNEVSKLDDVTISGSLIDTLSTIQIALVFDSLEKLLIPYRDEVEDFIQLLMTRTDGVQLLITSQIDLSIFDHEKALIKLDGISDQYSSEILNSMLKKTIELEEQQLEWILWFCGGHPLSLKLVSSLINFYNSIGDTIEHLKKSDSIKQPLRKKHNKSNALSICLNTIYSILSVSQKEILSLSKFYPAGVKLDWAKSSLQLSDFESDLACLRQFFLIEITEDLLKKKRIIVQNPLRKFLYDRSKEDSLEKHFEYEKENFIGISIEAMLINQKYIERSTEGSAQEGILRMESELPNIMEAFHCSKRRLTQNENISYPASKETYLLIVENISTAIGKYFFVRGYYEQGIMIARESIKRSIDNQMYEPAAIQYIYLSQLQLRRYDFEGVEQCIKEIDELSAISTDDYVKISNHWIKGRYFDHKGESKKALEHLIKTERLMKEQIFNDRKQNDSLEIPTDQKENKWHEIGNLGLVYSELGSIHENERDFHKALKYYEEGLKIQLDLKDEINSLSAYYHVANCHTELGNLEIAIAHYFTCTKGFIKQGNHEFLANTLAELGRNVEFKPYIAQNEILSKAVFIAALDNLNYRIKYVITQLNQNNSATFNPESIPFALIGQMMLLVQLISLSKHSSILFEWARKLSEEIEFDRNGINHFNAIIKLAYTIGTFANWADLSKEKQETSLRTILLSCLIINGGPDIMSGMRIFYWLSEWFKRVQLDKEATAEKLSNRAMEL